MPDTDNLTGGFQGTYFTGYFDGNGHTISNLTIDDSGAGNDYLGLFGETGSGGQIKNLALKNVSITGGDNSNYLGGLTGWNTSGSNISNCHSTGAVSGGASSNHLGGLAGDNDGTISNCHSTGAVSGGNSSGLLGGLVGANDGGSISNCYSIGAVAGGSGSYVLGGLAGWNSDGGNISNCYSTGEVSSGANSLYLGGLVGSLASGTISNCFSTGTVTGGTNSTHLGGLVGYNSTGTISNCHSTGTVAAGNSSQYLGGLVGYSSGTISNCYSTATITGGNVSYYLGGLVGDNRDAISNCFSTGAVTGTSYLGGLVGATDGTISSCFSTAAVTGQNGSWYLGGLAGVNNNSISNCFATGPVSSGNPSQYLGGLVGYNNISISNCYSTGTVSGGAGISDIGGLVGYNDGGTVTDCFWDITTSGQATSAGGTGLSTENMKKQITFTNAGWDFDDIWRIRENAGYPKLHISDYSGGLGTAGAPYEIGTVSELLAMAANTGDYDAYFVLTANIDLAGAGPFTTAVIAVDANNSNGIFDGTVFSGVFDGNGHTISNLTIDTNSAGNDFLGLFGEIGSGGKIKNLGLKNVNITGGDNSVYLGGLAGWNASGSNISNCYSSGNISSGASSTHLGGLAGDNDGTISDCYSTGAINSGDNSTDLGGLVGLGGGTISNSYSTSDVNSGNSSQYLGGLIARNWGGGATINNCYSAGTVKGGGSSQNLGGLIGFNNSGGVSNCYSTGDVEGGANSQNLGGLVGHNFNATISNCYSTGTVTGTSNLGGLVGYNTNNSSISNCYSTGAVTGGVGSSGLGGLVGYNLDGSISNCYSTSTVTGGGAAEYLGGLVAVNNGGSINYCYSTGAVTGGVNYFGGLVGYNSGGGTISSCYFPDTEPNNGLGTPLKAAQMKQQKSFVGWDFVNIWWIAERAGYPKLFWQLNVTKCTVTAGSKPNTDKISFSGTMDATADDFNGINAVKVTIDSPDIVIPFDQNFPIDSNTFKKGKYNYSKTENGARKSFTYDVKTHKFAFSASNLDLSGLDCPVTAKIDINDFNATAELDETIVNGPKIPIPIKLMMGVKDVLRVDKCQVKHGKNPNTDQLSVKGAFAVEDPNVNMADRISEDLVVTLGAQQFTIPANKLKAGKGTFSCSKANVTEVGGGIATATFNFNTCSFILTIKNTANITATGTVDFGVAFADFNEVEQVTLP